MAVVVLDVELRNVPNGTDAATLSAVVRGRAAGRGPVRAARG